MTGSDPLPRTVVVAGVGPRLGEAVARRFAPEGVHVATALVDGGIARTPDQRTEYRDAPPERWMDAAAIADAYYELASQTGVWTHELDCRGPGSDMRFG